MECGEPRNTEGFEAWKRLFGPPKEESVPVTPSWIPTFRRTSTPQKETRHGTGEKEGLATLRSSSRDIEGKRSPRRRRTFREEVTVAAARLLVGAEGYDDGMDEATGDMGYSLARPRKAYVDVLHLDDRIR